MKRAKFCIGQIIHHRLFDYRGVIFDVDPVFCGTDEWYNAVAKSRPPKDQPWYHVLVDDAHKETYVAEQNLENDTSLSPIKHPLLSQYFHDYIDGRYASNHIDN